MYVIPSSIKKIVEQILKARYKEKIVILKIVINLVMKKNVKSSSKRTNSRLLVGSFKLRNETKRIVVRFSFTKLRQFDDYRRFSHCHRYSYTLPIYKRAGICVQARVRCVYNVPLGN